MQNEIIKMYEQGHNVLTIAKKLSVKAPYVYNVLKDYLKGKEVENNDTKRSVKKY